STCFDFTLVSEAEQKKKDTPPPSAPPAPVLFDEMGLSLGFVFISFMPVADATSYAADVYLSDCSDTSVESGPPIKLAWTSGQVAAETLNLTPKLLQHGWNIPPGSCHVPTNINSVSQTAFSIHVRAVNDGGAGPEGIWAFLADC